MLSRLGLGRLVGLGDEDISGVGEMAFIGSSVSSASVRRGHGVLTVCSLRRDVVVTPANSSSSMSRRDLLTLIGLGGVLSMGALVDSANAEEVAAPAAPATGATAPTKISGNYPTGKKAERLMDWFTTLEPHKANCSDISLSSCRCEERVGQHGCSL